MIDNPAAGGLPAGAIIMWHGLIADIPSGFLICDGSSGTPNLLGRFVTGVPSVGTNPGATGGASDKILDTHGGARGKQAPSVVMGDTDQWLGSYTSGTGNLEVDGKITDIRPLFYELAFIMKS